MNYTVWLVVPCYNEEEVLPTTADVLQKKLNRLLGKQYISEQSRVVLVDDGSKDKTWSIISKLHEADPRFIGLKLSRNQGHQNALMAGMMYAKGRCDCMISLDADLQDDIDVIDEFIEKYDEGCEVVYGVRKSRKKDTFFKRTTARGFYKLMNAAGAEVVYDHADYRLLGSKALDALEEYKEVNLFLRGIVPRLGFKSDMVYYERHERVAGVSKYPLKKMIAFAFDGITSFSVKPLRIISFIGMLFALVGFFFSLCSGIGLGYALVSYFMGVTVPGWTAIVCSVWLLGSMLLVCMGVMMLCLGVIGEYIGKIYIELKHRPRYIIDEVVE